jgi:hypothetical protein
MPHESAQAMTRSARQEHQETEDEHQFRVNTGFIDLEHDMPNLKNRFQYSLKDNLSSYLGAKNPFYSEADPETDYVWLLDNTAYQNRLGHWKAEFVAAYFRKNSGKDLAEVMACIIDKTGVTKDEKIEAVIAKRLQPLLDSILPAHAVQLDLQGVNVRLGPSGRDGISSDELAVPGYGMKDGDVITSKAVHADATPVNTSFATPKGWAVISDIDDTIKKTRM